MKILLVDDDVFLRDMYAAKFTESGDHVVTAKDGADALRLLNADSFDAVITDMVMPGMTGVELIEKIRALESAVHTKCFVLSNQSEESDIADAAKRGADGYIVKASLVPSEVVTKVHALMA
jgi:DNA-binding response OmpR family regulator